MSALDLTVAEVRKRVRQIGAERGDDECAHADEDQLHVDVLAAVSNGHPDSARLATEALKTQKIDFARWCA
jgi:hypothetical protein